MYCAQPTNLWLWQKVLKLIMEISVPTFLLFDFFNKFVILFRNVTPQKNFFLLIFVPISQNQHKYKNVEHTYIIFLFWLRKEVKIWRKITITNLLLLYLLSWQPKLSNRCCKIMDINVLAKRFKVANKKIFFVFQHISLIARAKLSLCDFYVI